MRRVLTQAKETLAGPYQFFILALCLAVLVTMGAEAALDLDPEVQTIIRVADTIFCVFFLGDFLFSLLRAQNRWRYLVTWGWIDLLSSIPAIGILRVGRAARVLRILRLLRGVRSLRSIAAFVLGRRAQSAVLAATLISLLLLFTSSIAILEFEKGEATNIRGAEDALWWSFVTMTTVGYGDHYPVTTGGRAVAALLMVAGVGLFGTFTGLLASFFLESNEGPERELERLRAEVATLRAALEDARQPGGA